LVRRIYDHAFEQGWLAEGDSVVDPFAGVALGALQAMRHGLHWHGCELEARFVDLGNVNIDLWNATYADHLRGWGTARLVQGDSRQLAEVVSVAGAVVSSPPYEGQKNAAGDQAAAPSFKWQNIEPSKTRTGAAPSSQWYYGRDYGTTPGQLGAMPAGEFAAAVSSPPYEGSVRGGGAGVDLSKTARDGDIRHQSLGQLTNPFEYSKDADNIGNQSGDTFWTAAKQIVAQVYQVLRPGGVAIWVTKAFVRNGKRVDFPAQWLELCEACGFEPLEWIRAWLVEDNGTQTAMFGDDKRLVKERKSFFRRLAEKKGSPPIDYEVVVIVRKPDGEGDGVNGCVSSPPFESVVTHDGGEVQQQGGKLHSDYGHAPGQLGAMRPGDFAAVVSSPPFAQAQTGGGIAKALTGESDYPLSQQGGKYQGYRADQQAGTPGNLASLPEGSLAAVTSGEGGE
jgi:hypothetical protein